MEEANITIIGAGVVGLAIAAKISENNKGVFILEKNSKYGQETSSHNSGVIHSGIHYPPGSLKAKMCVKANPLIYETCRKHRISHKRLGKLTVAVEEQEISELERLKKWGEQNGTTELRWLGREEVKRLEPNVEVERALCSSSTGIIEPDELMDHYHSQAIGNGAILATETEVQSTDKGEDGYNLNGVSVGEKFSIKTKCVINSAGLFSDKVAEMFGIDIDKAGYRLHHCKGDYFRVNGRPVKMLVYPVPRAAGLGTHLTPDLGGDIKLGPNDYYTDKLDYKVESTPDQFREDVKRFVPSITRYELTADMAGIRPKLQGPKMPFRDFVIRHEADRNLFGLIDLIGIESPGLTSAPTIAELVNETYENEIKK